jgi:hypothetical protein
MSPGEERRRKSRLSDAVIVTLVLMTIALFVFSMVSAY